MGEKLKNNVFNCIFSENNINFYKLTKYSSIIDRILDLFHTVLFFKT